MAKKSSRGIPEINAGSMADIAFLLLIFFLVTTTIDTDKGIAIKLPPMPEDVPQEDKPIKERNILKVLVNAADQLLVDGEPIQIKELKKKTKLFIDNPNNDQTLAETPGKAVVSLKNDRGTSYDIYVQVHNELKAAYNELRNEMAKREYGKSFEDCTKAEQKKITDYYKQIISEAEPEKIGG